MHDTHKIYILRHNQVFRDKVPNKHFHLSSFPQATDTQREFIFENPKLLGLRRQIGPKIFRAFGIFSAIHEGKKSHTKNTEVTINVQFAKRNSKIK